MQTSPTENPNSLLSHFTTLTDPRVERTQLHPLSNILVIAICAIICGADDWVAVARYGNAKREWLSGFLDLSNGIPAHDTFGRVFRLLNPDVLQACFVSWIKSIAKLTDGEVVAIDGKLLNGSASASKGRRAIDMVSAWACGNRLVLGQVKVDVKSNELKAIPELLALLDLKGCIVTADAMGTHEEIAEIVHNQGADYVLPLKDNQPILRQAVEEHFAFALERLPADAPLLAELQTVEDDHGRMDIREHFITEDVSWLPGVTGKPLWPGVRSIGMVRSIRVVNDKESTFVRYYITSLPADAEKFANAVRSHWCIENQLHWVLDVAFDQDNNRTCTGHSAHNLAILHSISLNLLKQDKSCKLGIKNRRLSAAWDNAYLAKLLFN
jgi:predicted transposase YbfD/YdcC